jgi:hypothetical protein
MWFACFGPHSPLANSLSAFQATLSVRWNAGLPPCVFVQLVALVVTTPVKNSLANSPTPLTPFPLRGGMWFSSSVCVCATENIMVAFVVTTPVQNSLANSPTPLTPFPLRGGMWFSSSVCVCATENIMVAFVVTTPVQNRKVHHCLNSASDNNYMTHNSRIFVAIPTP